MKHIWLRAIEATEAILDRVHMTAARYAIVASIFKDAILTV